MAIDVEATYRRLGPMVLRRCHRLLGADGRAEDVMHDVFVQLVRDGPRLDERGTAGLLLRMTTQVCLNHLRGRRRRPEDLTGEAQLLGAIVDATDPEARAAAGSMLNRLFSGEPESTATIAVLFLLDGLTLEQVASEVGLSVSGVRKRLRTLRARLPQLADFPETT
jgi:RNA polymerase sigma-70 factor (ECF subfamily)